MNSFLSCLHFDIVVVLDVIIVVVVVVVFLIVFDVNKNLRI